MATPIPEKKKLLPDTKSLIQALAEHMHLPGVPDMMHHVLNTMPQGGQDPADAQDPGAAPADSLNRDLQNASTLPNNQAQTFQGAKKKRVGFTGDKPVA